MDREKGKSEDRGSHAPGQQKTITVKNVDPTKPDWVGTKADFNTNKVALKAQGYQRDPAEVAAEEAGTGGTSEEPGT